MYFLIEFKLRRSVRIQCPLSGFQGGHHYFKTLFRSLVAWRNYYFLVDNDWGKCFSLVYYEWGVYDERDIDVTKTISH